MATMKPIYPPACNEPRCTRAATQEVLQGDNGPLEGRYCGGHAIKHLRATAKTEGRGEVVPHERKAKATS